MSTVQIGALALLRAQVCLCLILLCVRRAVNLMAVAAVVNLDHIIERLLEGLNRLCLSSACSTFLERAPGSKQ